MKAHRSIPAVGRQRHPRSVAVGLSTPLVLFGSLAAAQPSSPSGASPSESAGVATTAPASSVNPPDPRRDAAKPTHWYGWQTLIADGAWMLTLASQANRNGSPYFAALAGADYLLGPPIVHFAHQNWRGGLGSFALRTLPPLTGAAFYVYQSSDSGSSDIGPALFVIVVATLIPVIIVDSYALANEPRTTSPNSSNSVVVVPHSSISRHGATLGLSASF